MNKKIFLSLLVLLLAALTILLLREGEMIIPRGNDVTELEVGAFESYSLPDYVLPFVTKDYKSYFVEVEAGIKIHILEVGSGYPVYLQHGNPTSGLLYRSVANVLPKDRFRLIMPTLVGLGFSSKIPASEHTLNNHIRWLNETLTQLKIKNLIYVGQDWGGPIGMGALALSPGIIKGAVLLNTGFKAPDQPMDLSYAHAVVRTPVIGELLLETFISIFKRLPQMQGDPQSIPPEVIRLYEEPLKSSGNDKAPLALMRMVPDGPSHPSTREMKLIEEYVQSLRVPAEIVWGIRDPILGNGLELMKRSFPDALVTETQAGHFLQEEVYNEIAESIIRIADKIIIEKKPSSSKKN